MADETRADGQPVPYHTLSPAERRLRLQELAAVFLKLGTTAFGGPAAHIAMMDEEVVRRRRWLDRQTFLDLLAAANLIPGPNSTELAIGVGYLYGGPVGLLVAGACFIVPAMAIVWVLAAIYVRYQAIPEVGWLLYGIKPVIVAIVAQALWGLSKSAVKTRVLGGVGVLALGLAVLGWNQLLVLLLAGGVVVLAANWRRLTGGGAAAALAPAPLLMGLGAASPEAPARAISWAGIFWAFAKVGSVIYGSGYVLLAFLQQDLVERLHWLSTQQLLDAVAIGQFTPGPVFTTATFIGYLLGGSGGAVAATLGIFAPAFLFVALVHPFVSRLRRSAWAAAFLDGVTVASLALMAQTTWLLGRAAVTDWLTALLALGSLAVVLRTKVNSAWLVAGGGVIGLVAHLLH
jgi:chromate transporter